VEGSVSVRKGCKSQKKGNGRISIGSPGRVQFRCGAHVLLHVAKKKRANMRSDRISIGGPAASNHVEVRKFLLHLTKKGTNIASRRISIGRIVVQ
jgi:hypothetical protein